MSVNSPTDAYVRTEEAPWLPPPVTMVGVPGWILTNLFPSIGNGILTIIAGAFLLWIGWGIFDWALLNAVWSGNDREVCAVEGAGACWPFAAVTSPDARVHCLVFPVSRQTGGRVSHRPRGIF